MADPGPREDVTHQPWLSGGLHPIPPQQLSQHAALTMVIRRADLAHEGEPACHPCALSK